MTSILDSKVHGQAKAAEAVTQIPVAHERYLFPDQRATILNVSRRVSLSMQFKRICERLGIKDKSFHCLRHSALPVRIFEERSRTPSSRKPKPAGSQIVNAKPLEEGLSHRWRGMGQKSWPQIAQITQSGKILPPDKLRIFLQSLESVVGSPPSLPVHSSFFPAKIPFGNSVKSV